MTAAHFGKACSRPSNTDDGAQPSLVILLPPPITRHLQRTQQDPVGTVGDSGAVREDRLRPVVVVVGVGVGIGDVVGAGEVVVFEEGANDLDLGERATRVAVRESEHVAEEGTAGVQAVADLDVGVNEVSTNERGAKGHPEEEGGVVVADEGVVLGLGLEVASLAVEDSRELVTITEVEVGVLNHLLLLERSTEAKVGDVEVLAGAGDLEEAGVDGVALRVEAARRGEDSDDGARFASAEGEARGGDKDIGGVGDLGDRAEGGVKVVLRDGQSGAGGDVGDLVGLGLLAFVGDGEGLTRQNSQRHKVTDSEGNHSHRLVVSSVVQDKVAGRNESGGVESIVDLNETSTLLSEGLGKGSLIERVGNADGGGLEEIAGSAVDGGVLALNLEEKSGSTSSKGAGHGCSRLDGVATHGDRDDGENVATGGAEGRLEIHVVGRTETVTKLTISWMLRRPFPK